MGGVCGQNAPGIHSERGLKSDAYRDKKKDRLRTTWTKMRLKLGVHDWKAAAINFNYWSKNVEETRTRFGLWRHYYDDDCSK